MRLLALVVLLLIPACTQARYYETVVEEATKEAKDIEAAALEDAPCLIGLGAWSRMTDPRRRNGVFVLCVPDSGDYGLSVTRSP